MKTMRLLTLATLAIAALSSANAAPVDVRLEPNPSAPVIATLDSPALAVSAEWPDDQEPVPGWRPILFRNEFTVFVSNSEIGKDLAPKEGASYLLSPSADAPVLSNASAGDDAELISVDPRYARLRLSTVALSYIRNTTPPAPSAPPAPVANPTPAAQASQPASNASIDDSMTTPVGGTGGQTIKTLTGILVKANTFERVRFGLPYKLIGKDNKTLAFVNTEGLPKFVLVKDYINAKVSITGPIAQAEKGDRLILTARNLKKAI